MAKENGLYAALPITSSQIGNADAHGKNFSLLYVGGKRRLSPYYDLVSTVVFPGISEHLTMKIGGCKSVNAFAIDD